MVSKKFYTHIVIRIILILLTCISILPFVYKEERLFTIFSLLVLLILQIYLLIQYINKFNNEIASFFASLKTNDASFAFHDKSLPYINQEFRSNIESIRNQLFDITQQKEIRESYLKTLIEKASTGIISFNESGQVDIINRHALELLNIESTTHIRPLEKLHPGFYHFIQRAKAGDEKMIMIKGASRGIPLSIRVSEFRQKSEAFKLISFQNIESELNEKELLSWNKLIRVLTHEINNSISPIVSLSNSLEKLFIKDQNTIITKENVTNNTIEKNLEGIQLISKRGEGLIRFVNNYKSIASLKQIEIEKFKVAELFYNLEQLLKSDFNERNIKLQIDIKPFDLELNADRKYIEQIFINLIKNSVESIDNKNGLIKLTAFLNKKEHLTLQISDNGHGISKEVLDQVFIPFFTTKEEGSGIGLSLARQIMRLHGGSISVQSTPKLETVFTLTF